MDFLPIGSPPIVFRGIHGPHHPRHQPLDPQKILPLIHPKIMPHLRNHPRKLPPRYPLPVTPIKFCGSRTPLATMIQGMNIPLKNGQVKEFHLLRPRALDQNRFLSNPAPPPTEVGPGHPHGVTKISIGHSGLLSHPAYNLQDSLYRLFPPFCGFVLFFLAP
jgi:hypothetical protein